MEGWRAYLEKCLQDIFFKHDSYERYQMKILLLVKNLPQILHHEMFLNKIIQNQMLEVKIHS